ncbi:hypothetical protein FA04_28585 (plasmid) [Ensifer adhaerens]|uniref:Uncharacterized protein n=1 Tax=Ensifer adhaerens TaxID=106592 RepID=A0ABY8HUD4_ENSAD|nr:hypothetical protein [Ensifer adhaerens]ANK76685.1 hypothetical protein FA04_28585 [Ensifer adhaerens]KDP72666.1 hypothetical protein FA04_16490 [Ensifer adhaerens]WFP95107.1 hypothetical protein P4B07_28995 [Ensifer adhaerens]
MFVPQQSGYILPEDFTVIATVYEKIVSARAINRQSDEGEWLARYTLELFMSGTRDARELETRLEEFSLPMSGDGKSRVVDLLPDLSAWARSLTASPSEATALTEQTLDYAIEHVEEFIATSDVRRWLVRLMVELRLGRRPR